MDELFGTIFLTLVALGLFIAWALLRSRGTIPQNYESYISVDVDGMNGHDFEAFVAKLLQSRGFSTEVTSPTGDFGADVVATNAGTKCAVQCKRNAIQNKVSVRAVQEAVAAVPFYDCDKAMVITTGYFTNQAVQYAGKIGCDLVGRDTLMTWIKEFERDDQRANDQRHRATARRNATRKRKAQAIRLKKELTETDSADLVPLFKQNTVPVLRGLATLLGMSSGKDRKPDLIKRIAAHIENRRADRKSLVETETAQENRGHPA